MKKIIHLAKINMFYSNLPEARNKVPTSCGLIAQIKLPFNKVFHKPAVSNILSKVNCKRCMATEIYKTRVTQKAIKRLKGET